MSDLLFTSLTDLADMNTDDIAVLRNRLQREGIYIVEMESAEMREIEQEDPTKKPRASLRWQGSIVYYEPLNPNAEDSDVDMIGKAYNQFETVWLSDLAEAIGLLKGRYVAAHLPVAGAMGGFADKTGWLTDVVGKRVAIRVRHVSRNDDTRVYYDWLGYKALKRLDLSWDEMGREPLDKNGNVIEMED